MARTYLLWDASHIWGLMAWRGLCELGLSPVLATATQIAQGALAGKSEGLLVVPGGNARAKTRALGKAGVAAMKSFVAEGGFYLGLCGGAGLGLSDGGAGLCPWSRKPFAHRLQHLISGHLRCAPASPSALVPDFADQTPLLPVWWPARFAPGDQSEVEVLASFETPHDDLYVADIRLDSLPPSVHDDWRAKYGVTLWPGFLLQKPCLVSGKYGRGRYVLSYAHLETPDSPHANRWLAHLAGAALGQATPCRRVGPWEVAAGSAAWDDPVLARAWATIEGVVEMGMEHFLLFSRTPWLLGWRRGLPGLAVNSLRTLLAACREKEPTDEALAFWREHEEEAAHLVDLFSAGVRGYLLAERLDMTLSHSPDSPHVTGLAQQREALFGTHGDAGGPAGRLQSLLEDLAARCLRP